MSSQEPTPSAVALNSPLGCLTSWFQDWPRWWSEQTVFRKYFVGIFVPVYWLVLHALNGLNQDHFLMGGALLVLNYAGRRASSFFLFTLPVLATGIIYDSQRYYSDYIRGRIHVEEPYLFDKFFFGIKTAQGVLTPNEWWQLNTHPVLDFVTGFFYLTFILIFMLIAGYFTFWLSRPGKGTRKMSAEKIRQQAPRLMWGFLWLNLLGYSTYYWYAAAPPWYVSLYGLGPADLTAPANPAGCIRFDQLLGTNFFTGMYGRSADVFGAIPSLHIAYPLLAVYYAFRFGALRGFSIFFFVMMSFSAVYLNHHYILDIIWGSAYALLIGWMTDKISDRRNLRV